MVNRMPEPSASATFLSLQRWFTVRAFGLVTCFILKRKHVESNTGHGLSGSGGGGVRSWGSELGFSGSQNMALTLGLVHQAEGQPWFVQPILQALVSHYKSSSVPVGQRFTDWQFQEGKAEQSNKEITHS